jgi:flavin-dependent dehydrogenase
MGCLWATLLAGCALCAAVPARQADVVIYGATPAGMAAAVAAQREGASVLVIEPTGSIGGMVTGGIAITDTGTPQWVGGLARKFFEEVAEAQARPAKEEPPSMSFRGRSIPFRTPRRWDIEPKNAKQVFERWAREHRLAVMTGKTVAYADKSGGRIRAVTFSDGTRVEGRVFIDAGYEGDLMAKAGVSHTWGRESAAEYKETLAGIREPHFRQNYGAEVYNTPGIEYMHHGQFGADIAARDAKGRLLWGWTAVRADAWERATTGCRLTVSD